jgi:hypothetical protein
VPRTSRCKVRDVKSARPALPPARDTTTAMS